MPTNPPHPSPFFNLCTPRIDTGCPLRRPRALRYELATRLKVRNFIVAIKGLCNATLTQLLEGTGASVLTYRVIVSRILLITS